MLKKAVTKEDAFFEFINEFKSKYSDLEKMAIINIPMTQTDGWKNRCMSFYSKHKLDCTNISIGLRESANRVAEYGLDTEGMMVKAIKEIAKKAGEIVESEFYFRRDVIEPIADSAGKCEKLIGDTLKEASDLDMNHPMQWQGIQASIEDAIKQLTRYRWDAETYEIVAVKPK